MDRKKTKKSKATNKKASDSEVLATQNTKKRAASPKKKNVKKSKKTSELPPASVKIRKSLSSPELPDIPEPSDDPELSEGESGAELSSRSSSPEVPASNAKKGGKSEKVDANGWFTKEQIFQMRTNYIVEKLNGKSKDDLTDADKTFILEQVDLEIEHLKKGNVTSGKVGSSDKPKDTNDQKVQTIESGDVPDSSSGDEGSGDDQKEQSAVQKMKLLFTEGKADSHKAEVDNLMKESFAERREFILKVRPLVFQIKQHYPLLFRFDQIKKEVTRVFHVKSCDIFYVNTKKYCRNIFNLCPDSMQRDVAQYLDAAETKKDKETICQSGSFLLLPHIMDSEAHFVVYPEGCDNPTEYPHIEAPSKHDILMNTKKMKVVVENVTICRDLPFLDAVLCMLACYYIFGIIYPDSLANILIVIERLFLEVSETKRIPASVTQVMTKIKSNQI